MKIKPLALLFALPPYLASAAEPLVLDEILVTAQRPDMTSFSQALTLPPSGQDISSSLNRLPGAAVVSNGPLTGIAQVRGLSGDRVNILMDGMDITPACPNHMDPPLHYAAAADTQSMTLIAGASPVSAGGDALGASILVRSVRPEFVPGDAWQTGGKLDAGFSGANDGWNLGLNAHTGNQNNAFSYAGNFSEGDDLNYADGEVKDTGYQSRRNKLSFAHAGETGRFDVSVSQHRVKDAGNPALPMDMIKDDADAANLAWEGKIGDVQVNTRLYWHDIEHLMDNYSLRPNIGTWMYAPANSTDIGLVLGGKRKLASGSLHFGAEWLHNEFDTYQWNATANAFNADILRDATRERLGLFGEWQGQLAGAWSANIGLRSDTVNMDTGNVRFGPAQAEATTGLGGAFNALSHEKTDHNWDWNALFQYLATPELGYEIGLTRKTRSPSLLERYEWTPLNASAGQADNNSYYGNLDLKPEVAHTLSLALQGDADAHRYRLGAFYQRVSNYIVGTPIANPTGAATPANVLQYQNHDARLEGLEASWAYQSGAWHFSSVLSYVRGRNLDSNGDLYRIAPLRLDLTAEYRSGTWSNSLHMRTAKGQDAIAEYNLAGLNNELNTPGYAVFDWHGQWQASKTVKLNLGIDNLFDTLYFDHLGGINRVGGGDIAIGSRLPSAGRFAFAQLEWTL
jgi:iron complex outermembrane receptor protein